MLFYKNKLNWLVVQYSVQQGVLKGDLSAITLFYPTKERILN